MRYRQVFFVPIIILFFCGSAFMPQKNTIHKNPQLFGVSGKVMGRSPYCGGMAPSEEMIRQSTEINPIAGKRYFLKRGSVNQFSSPVVLSFESDQQGEFEFQLEPGNYCVLLPEQVHEKSARDYEQSGIKVSSEACLENWRQTCHAVLEVRKDVDGLNLTYSRSCFIPEDNPCLIYEGPYPA